MSASPVEGLELLYRCKGWNHLWLQLDHEVRLVERIVEGDGRCWLWERGIVSFAVAGQTEGCRSPTGVSQPVLLEGHGL